ncbi:MAG: ribonuclease J, partial [Acidimicrobiales bacterium]|nr:ribonuclease J [Acidimicrobiales bacterium]
MAEPVTITFLGGLGEIGRNCAAIEIDQRIMLLDCGLMFPEADMPGVDLVLPDFTYLLERRDRIEGCILTHGHEDHVGGLSFLLRELSFPIIGSALALGLARSRIEEARLLHRTELIPVADNERRSFGPFDCEFIPVTHSVPHGFATAFHTPQGTILHSGDFKLDLNPVDGRRTDLATIGAVARQERIRLLLSDSTNACERGHSRSESSVGKVLYDLFHASRGRRVITACFASHIHRVQQIADSAIAFDRVIATLGRSMQRNVKMAREMGLLSIPSDRLIDIADIGDRAPGEVCIISTGSQGEPMSALSLMAAGESRWLKLTTNDTVILSSSPIPGNEMSVTKVLDRLARQGVQVIHSGIEDVHATGHAKAEELKTLLSVAEPEWFTPVHGEYRHLVAHAELAKEMGVPANQAMICEDGDQLVLTDKGIHRGPSVPAGYLYVDGSGVGDVGQGVLRDRRVLAAEGIVVVLATVDVAAGELVGQPEVITKGWVHEASSAALLDGCTTTVADALRTALTRGSRADIDALHKAVRRAAGA